MATDADETFLTLGIQYYATARCAAIAKLMPVCGNIYHHAIEMFIKARLSQKYTLKELGPPKFGHKLDRLWTAFKAEFPVVDLTHFDDTITQLHKFDDIRYPDNIMKKGMAVLLMWERGQGAISYGPGVKPSPSYQLVVTEIDRLVAKIFEICSRDPKFFTGSMSSYIRDAMIHGNPVSEFLFESA